MFGWIEKLKRRDESEPSFSQCGEDRIAKFVLDVLGVHRYRYLDIGAHHPRRINNTYLFYALGGSGVLIEPNRRWLPLIHRLRPRDICLDVGLAGRAQSGVPFYVMKSDTLSTFSKREAERLVSSCGEQITEVRELEVLAPEAVLSAHFGEGLNLVSMDVEGLELEILEAFDLRRYRPEVFCIETISYAVDGSGAKSSGLVEFMVSNGYMVFADTHINTIFVDRSRWESQGR